MYWQGMSVIVTFLVHGAGQGCQGQGERPSQSDPCAKVPWHSLATEDLAAPPGQAVAGREESIIRFHQVVKGYLWVSWGWWW